MKKRILCYGDSNTWGAVPGVYSRYPEDVRWTCILQKLLGEDYVIIEEGYNGRTTVWDDPVEGRLSGITYFLPCVESQCPLDLIIICLGVNDLKPRFGASAVTIAGGLEKYFDVLRYARLDDSEPKVLIMSPACVDPSYKDNAFMHGIFGEDADERSRLLAPEYRAIAETYGAAFLDAAQYAKTGPEDGIHLDIPSHRRLAEALAEKIREILG